MDKIRSVNIAYFTGTGGTRKAAVYFAESCRNRGLSVEVIQIRAGSRMPAKADLLVLFYAVYAFSSPGPVYPWIASLPDGEGAPAAVVSVSGGGEESPNTACRTGAIRRLQRKGYSVHYEDMLIMPSNAIAATEEAISIELMRILPSKVDAIAEHIFAGQIRRTKPAFFDRAFSVGGRMEIYGARLFGRHIRAAESCNGCEWCAKGCPTGNIMMKEGRPVFGKKCILCTRCMYGCPQKSLSPAFFKSFLLKDGFSIPELEKKLAVTPPVSVSELPVSGLSKAIEDYLKNIRSEI
ncbi:MAG: EFR1 family ferrodoxin [Eubacteriales bacterium]